MSDEQALSAEQIKQLVQADQMRRMQACQTAMQAALQQYGCELYGEPQIVDGRIVAVVGLRAVA